MKLRYNEGHAAALDALEKDDDAAKLISQAEDDPYPDKFTEGWLDALRTDDEGLNSETNQTWKVFGDEPTLMPTGCKNVFYVEYVKDKPNRLPSDLPKPLEMSGHKWVYRGTNWKTKEKVIYAAYMKGADDWTKPSEPPSDTTGFVEMHYVEYCPIEETLKAAGNFICPHCGDSKAPQEGS